MVKQILRKSLNLDRWLLRQGRDYGFYLGPWHPAEAQRHHPATVGLGAAGGCLELMVDYHGLLKVMKDFHGFFHRFCWKIDI